jgi:hypothetical protein
MQFARAFRLSLSAAAMAAAADAAPAPEASPYEAWSFALAADQHCGLLNVVEHQALQRAVADLERGPNARALAPGGDFAAHARQMAARAAPLDCASQAAADAVFAGRTKALLDLATAAVVAANVEPMKLAPLTPREHDLALVLNTYLDRVLGADAQRYIDPAQSAAAAATQTRPGDARDRLRAVLGDVEFQGAAEGSGYKATMFAPDWIRLTDNGSVATLVGRRDFCRSADASIQNGFECYLMVRNGQVSAFFRDGPAAAKPMAAPAVVRLYLRKPDAAIRTAQGDPIARSAGWRSNTAAYEGIKGFTPFLGVAVYDFGPVASAALLNQTPNDFAEVAVAPNAAARDAANGSPPNLFALDALLAEQRARRP